MTTTDTPPPTSKYIVQKGDTLSTIAAKFGVSIAALQLENALGEKQAANLGATLRIPSTKLADDESTYWFIYIVKAGDTLSTIAARFKVEPAEVLRVNRIDDPSRILIDQTLIIPVKAPRIGADVPLENSALNSRTEPQLIALATPISAAADTMLVSLAPQPTPQPTPVPVDAKADGNLLASSAPIAAQSATSIDDLRMQMLALYNEQRTAAGLPPLQMSLALQAAAQAHAEDCATRGFGSHYGSDGSTARKRIARAGFAGATTGENWAFAPSVSAAFSMWFFQESPGGPHRRNIMSTSFSYVGVGITPFRSGFIFIIDLGG